MKIATVPHALLLQIDIRNADMLAPFDREKYDLLSLASSTIC